MTITSGVSVPLQHQPHRKSENDASCSHLVHCSASCMRESGGGGVRRQEGGGAVLHLQVGSATLQEDVAAGFLYHNKSLLFPGIRGIDWV